MPRPTRQFEPQITRSGGAPAKYRFTTRCSECLKTDIYEANQFVSDDVVKGYFKERGWLLGRDRSYDLCPGCLARPRGRQPMHRDAATSAAMPADKRQRETADILARHLGKPETLAADVFRPKDVQVSRPTTPDAAQPPALAPALSPALEQALTGMAADLKSLRSTMELIAEQMSKLLVLGGQQIEAVARLAPLLVQSTDRISGGLADIVTAVRLHSKPSDIDLEQQPSLIEPRMVQDQKPSRGPEPEPAVQAATPAKSLRRARTDGSTGRKSASDHVVVKSIADATRPERFYTTIRLPRELWDRSGFGPDDRLQIDWKRKSVSISRVLEGGVKPKTVGNAVVVLQSWRLGDLNFDATTITAGEGLLRLKAP